MWSDNVTLIVEIGFGSGPYAAAPTWTDVVSDVRAVAIRRGRASINREFDAGTLILTLDNLDGDFDPNNTTSPHNPNLKLGTPIRVRALHNAITYDLFRGHIDVWPLIYDELDATVVLECVENLALLRLDEFTAQAYSQEKTDVRIGNILDDAGWPAGARALDAGSLEVAAVTFTGSPSTLISQILQAEQGHLYIAGNGDATFKNRTAFSTLTSQATYDPGTNLDYEDMLTLLYDDDFLINKATVTAAAGTVQTASDATSITDHGPAGFASVNTALIGEPDALNVAEWIVGTHKDVIVRVTGFMVQPETDQANLWPEVLSRELLELVTVKLDPPGAGTNLDQIVAIQSVKHDVTPGEWHVTYTCYPLSTFESQDYWILGTSQLDTGTRLA